MGLLLTAVPLLDEQLAVMAYLFRYQANAGDYVAGYSPLLEVLRKVSVEAFSADKPIFVPIGARVLLSEDFDFPPEKIIFLLEPDVRCEEPYLTEIRALRRRGFRIAAFGDQKPEMLNILKYLLFEHGVNEPKDPKVLHQRFVREYPHIDTVLMGIPCGSLFEQAFRDKYTFFEGTFYTDPVLLGEKVAPLKVNLIRLLNVIRDENFEFDVVADIVRNDPALTLSLMRFINSPYLGIRHRVRNIQQAVVILGQSETRKWVTAAVFRSLGSDKPSELTRLSLVRAKLAERLALLFSLEKDAQSLFMMGLFSMLDSILNVRMEQAMDMIYLSEEIQDALVSGKGRYYQVLSFIKQYEKADWRSVLHYLKLYNLNIEDVYEAYLESLGWYNTLISEQVRPLRLKRPEKKPKEEDVE